MAEQRLRSLYLMPKSCTKCGGTGPFSQDKKSRDGFSRNCKKCVAAYTRRWAAANAVNPTVSPTKNCTGCGGSGPFYTQRGTKDGLTYKCIECIAKNPSRQPARQRERAVARRKKDPERAKAKDAVERLKYAGRRKDNWDSWAYGLEPGGRQKLIAAQDGKCAICLSQLKAGQTDVDHDHLTLKIRGVLCRLCNRMLGSFRDSPQVLLNAVTYLDAEITLPVLEVLQGRHDWGTAAGRRAYQRRDYLSRNYGITLEQFNWLLAGQGSKCPICYTSVPSSGRACHVDHDHKSGRVRGVLCGKCNVGLGQARDTADILRAAAAYLSVPVGAP